MNLRDCKNTETFEKEFLKPFIRNLLLSKTNKLLEIVYNKYGKGEFYDLVYNFFYKDKE